MLLDKLLSNLDIYVEQFSLCEVTRGRRLRMEASPRVMLHFMLTGRGSLQSTNGTAHSLEPCMLAVVPRDAEHWLESRTDTKNKAPIGKGAKSTSVMVVACGVIKVRYGAALGLFDKLEDILVEDLSDIPRVRTAFNDILSEQTLAGPGSEAMKAALMSQCIVHLFRRLCEKGNCSLPWLVALDDEGLARALERILQSPAEPHTVESLAEVASMSRSAFAEAFTTAFGMPPMSMLRRIRMERAWKLLELGDGLPVESVARRVGFASRSHFSRAFKRHFGVSPLTRRTMPS